MNRAYSSEYGTLTNFARITSVETSDGHRITAWPNHWACIKPFAGAVVLVIVATSVFLAEKSQPDQDPSGSIYFACLLLTLAIGASLLGVSAFRNRISCLIEKERVVVEQSGLLKKRHLWNLTQNETYYLLVGIHERPSYMGRRNAHIHVASLDAVNSQGRRQRLLDNVEDLSTVGNLASTISEILDLPLRASVNVKQGQNEETVFLEAHQEYLEDERDKALAEMKASLVELEKARDVMQTQVEKDGIRSLVPDELQDAGHRIAVAEKEIRQAEFQVCLQRFDSFNFTVCRPGDIVRYERLELDSFATLRRIVCLSGTIGVSILIFMLTPIVIPLLGQLIMMFVDTLPLSVTRLQAHFAIIDLFKLDLQVFLWAPFLIALYVLWTWLKVDASLAPFRVSFDWARKRLRIERRGPTHDIEFNSIGSLSMAIIRQTKAAPRAAWKNHAALFVGLNGSRVSILELVFDTEEVEDDATTMDRFEPLASTLANSLDVPLLRIGKRKERFDIVGVPFSLPMLHVWRIWRLASSEARKWACAGLLLASGLLIVLFSFRFQANRTQAEQDIAAQTSPTSADEDGA